MKSKKSQFFKEEEDKMKWNSYVWFNETYNVTYFSGGQKKKMVFWANLNKEKKNCLKSQFNEK